LFRGVRRFTQQVTSVVETAQRYKHLLHEVDPRTPPHTSAPAETNIIGRAKMSDLALVSRDVFLPDINRWSSEQMAVPLRKALSNRIHGRYA
jgi:hypothetical protein